MRTANHPASIARRAVSAVAAAVSFLSACSVLGSSDSGVSFATEPPGARVVVDRKDSGFVTPCRMALETGRHRVDLELPGYAQASLRLESDRRTDVILWRDMYARLGVWRFPLWLNVEDALEPVKVRKAIAPGHVFVRLERASHR
jgi:hypothetical protein